VPQPSESCHAMPLVSGPSYPPRRPAPVTPHAAWMPSWCRSSTMPARLETITGGASARALAALLVPVGSRHAPVTTPPPARRVRPPVHTAWMSQRYRWSSTNAAFTPKALLQMMS